MKTKFQKTFTSLLLIAALAISGISYQGKQAKAADANYAELFTISNLEENDSILPAGQEVTQNFMVSSNGTIGIAVMTYAKTAMTMKIISSTGKELYNKTVLSSDSSWYEDVDANGFPVYYKSISWEYPTSGNYTLSVTFDTSTYYGISAVQGPAVAVSTPPPAKTPTPSLNTQAVTVTVGFSQTISTYNTTGNITWTSSNPKVATVKGGKITGKKAGTATISAKTATGYTMTCKVTVRKNVYKLKKLSVKQITYGKSGIDIYNVSYDKKGNLVIKTRILNNNIYKLKELRGVKIKIKDNNGKQIGTYSAKKIKKVNLKAGKAKSYTFKIKKSKLKKKKADLPLLTTKVSGKAYYIR